MQWIGSLNLNMQVHPNKKSNGECQSCYTKAYKRHLYKSDFKRYLFSHRDIKAENKDYYNSVENHNSQRQVNIVKDKIGEKQKNKSDDIGHSAIKNRF